MKQKKQSGSVLLISLVILLALTLLVLSGSQSVVVQEKMISAVRDVHISLEVAESGIKDAETVIEGLTDISLFTDAGTDGFYSEGHGPDDVFDANTWADNVTSEATTLVSGQSARYFIEYLGQDFTYSDTSSVGVVNYGETKTGSDIHLFKVVARSLGRSGNAERIVMSHYAKSF